MEGEVGGRSTSAVEARRVLGMRVDATSYEHAATEILGWASHGEPRYVCIATVNNVIEAHDNPAYQRVMEDADLVTPDGMPLVWGLGLLGVRGATRVYGPDLTPILCQRAAAAGIPVGFYGSTPEVLADLTANLARRCPNLRIAYAASPPFKPQTPDEDAAVRERIDRSGVRVLFVGLGTPKQELWMAANPGGRAGRHGRGRGRVRLHRGAQAAGAEPLAAARPRMALPSGQRATTALAAVPVSQSEVRRALRGAAPQALVLG